MNRPAVVSASAAAGGVAGLAGGQPRGRLAALTGGWRAPRRLGTLDGGC